MVSLPYGIAVDKDSNVYFASLDIDSIIVLSSSGKQARKLLERDDGISQPYGLAFDVKNDRLMVANYHEPSLYEFC